MPKSEQSIAIQNLDTDTALSIAYEAFKKLNWTAQFAGPDKLLAITIKKWNSYPQQIIVGVEGILLRISSEMVHGESFDLGKKNEKNIKEFIAAFQQLENTITEELINANRQEINLLREKMDRAAEEDAQQAAELDQVMHLSNRNLSVTYGIIIANVALFIAMLVKGVPLFSPTGLDILPWGGNFGPFTLSGEWWRLFANIFLHFGIIHIGFNMYALYMISIYLEPMLGKVRFAVAYLCTGIVASVVSLWWHLGSPAVSAGASGAIFGMYGVFLALLSTSLIPKKTRGALLQSIGVFIVFNLLYGFKSGIDNSAHVGGLVSGLFIGYAYYFTLKKEFATKSIALVSTIIIAITASGTYLFLQKEKQNKSEEVIQLKNQVNDAKYPDADKYNRSIQLFGNLEEEALKPYSDSLNNTELTQALDTYSKPKWQQALTILKDLQTLNVSDNSKRKALLFEQYVQLRIVEIDLLKQTSLNENETTILKLNETRKNIKSVIDSLQVL